ncbi:hypothetical protein [Haloferax sp. Atlit-47N]|uniref:hypothetical protein n=1 Tax=Haloferax sp. Atlit-47N TaxID=2077199 RepID=UPI0011C039B5|nr:hypothetical protein [Haloferax sp. Atlit-47N]
MTETNQSDQIEKIKRCVENIGDDVATIKTTKSAEGKEFQLLVCFHGTNRYVILEDPDQSYFEISYEFHLTEQIAARLSPDNIAERTGLSPDEVEQFEEVDHNVVDDDRGDIVIAQKGDDLPPPIQAAQDVIESLDKEVLERFGLNLFQELSQPEVAVSLRHTENEYFDGFRISRKVFPDDSGFSVTEFNNSVQSVITVGTFGHNWIAQLLGSELEEEFEQINMD